MPVNDQTLKSLRKAIVPFIDPDDLRLITGDLGLGSRVDLEQSPELVLGDLLRLARAQGDGVFLELLDLIVSRLPVLAGNPAIRAARATLTDTRDRAMNPTPAASPASHRVPTPTPGPALEPHPAEPAAAPHPAERRAAFAFAVAFLVALLGIALAVRDPSPLLYTVSRIVLALAAAGFAAFIPGFLEVEVKPVLRAGGALAVFVMTFWFSPAPLPDAQPYHVRVDVLGPDGQPRDDVSLRSSPAGGIFRRDGVWEIVLEPTTLPADHTLQLYAATTDGMYRGAASAVLDDDRKPVVRLGLERDDSARVRGRVLDAQGAPVSGARVMVAGHAREAVVTGSSGEFDLPAHTAAGQQVRLRAEGPSPSIGSAEDYYQAGYTEATLILEVR